MTIHLMLAQRTKCPELALDQAEADLLAEKIAQVQQVFEVEVNPRTKAVIELAIAGGTIYGTRAFSIVMRKKAEAARPING